MLTFILASVVVGIVCSIFFARYQKVRLIEKIPGPPALPLVGNAVDLAGTHEHLFRTLMDFTKIGNGITRIYLGLQPYCLLSKAQTAETVLSSNDIIDKSGDYEFLHPWIGTGLLTSTGKKWKSRRKLLTPTFHFKILEDFVEVFNHQAKRFVNKLQSKVKEEPFDMFPLVALCTLDVILETAMGTDVNVQSNSESEYVKALTGISELLQTRQFSPWLHSDLMFKLFGFQKIQDQYIKTMHDFSLGIISDRRREYNKVKDENKDLTSAPPLGSKKRLAFLDLLLEASKREDVQLSNEDIREEVDTFMFEGHDTTAAALSFAIYLLGKHPEIQSRVMEEIREVLDDGPITSDQLRELKFLEACIKEALRLFPSVPLIGRKLLKPAIIDGYEIPSGTVLVTVIYKIHRDPEQFSSPEVFNPDRFMGDEIVQRHPYAYVPFSAGPRNCIGQKFALMEEKIILAHFFRAYEVKATQTIEELGLLGELVLRPRRGIMVTISKRNACME